MIEDVFEQGTERMYGAAKVWIENNRRLLKQYRLLIERQMTQDPWTETLQDMMKMAINSFMQASTFNREARRHFLETQAAMADQYLAMLEEMEDNMAADGATAPPRAQSREAP